MNKNKPLLQRIKVVIIGVENSGKSTLVRKLSPNSKSIEHYDTKGKSITIGLDIGKIELAGCSLHFFGTPGHQRFEFARKIVSHGAHIGILLIDSVEVAKNGIGEREWDFEKELINKNIPYIVCATKRDLSGVLPLPKIKEHFKANIFALSAKSGDGIEELRNELVSIIESNKHEWLASSIKKRNLA